MEISCSPTADRSTRARPRYTGVLLTFSERLSKPTVTLMLYPGGRLVPELSVFVNVGLRIVVVWLMPSFTILATLVRIPVAGLTVKLFAPFHVLNLMTHEHWPTNTGGGGGIGPRSHSCTPHVLICSNPRGG